MEFSQHLSKTSERLAEVVIPLKETENPIFTYHAMNAKETVNMLTKLVNKYK